MPVENATLRVWFWLYLSQKIPGMEQTGCFQKKWVKLLKSYDDAIGINWTWQSIDSMSIKSPLGGAMTGSNPTDRSKLGTKRHILTDKKGIPQSVVVSSASSHDIKLVTDVVDNTVIRRPESSLVSALTHKTRRGLQHLRLDKAYNSAQEEQELIKRGDVCIYRGRKKKGEEDNKEEKTKEAIPNHKKHSAKRWVVERTNSWHNRFRKLFTR